MVPSASAGAPDDACDATGLLACAEAGEENAILCEREGATASCVVLREILGIGGSPSRLPGTLRLSSSDTITVCVERAWVEPTCDEHASESGGLTCDWTAGGACMLHATLLPHFVDAVALGPGDCLRVRLETATTATAAAVASLAPGLPTEATATAGTDREERVCA